MIPWLLARLDANPATVFYEAELRARDEQAFDALRSEAFFSRLPDLQYGDSFDWQTGNHLLSIVAAPDGSFEAVDLDDPSLAAFMLTEEMRRQWQVDRPQLIVRFRTRNQLSGPSEILAPRLLLLGQRDLEGGPTGCCFALLGNHDPVEHLAALPSLLGQRFAHLVVATMKAPQLTQANRLRAINIKVSPLSSTDPFLITELPLLGGLFYDAGLYRSNDYATVVWREQTFNFLKPEALVIALLHQASKAPNPDVLEGRLVRAVQKADLSTASELRDILRRSGAWNTLVIAGARRGYYRLNLP